MIEVNKLRKNFQYICKKNIAIIIMIILICPIIAISYSVFVVNTNNYRASEMFVGNLLYSIKVNGEPTNIATALPGENEVIVEVTSLNSISSNYKLAYKNNLNVIVFYASDDNQPSFGGIINTRTITLRIDNSSDENQNLELSIVGGFSHNEVSEISIPDGYSEVVQSYYKWDYETIALFVNEVRVEELDSDKSYKLQSYSCNADEVVKWYNANHTLAIEKMTASTKCQLNFIEQPIDIWNSYSCANGSIGSAPYTLNYTGNCSITHDEDDNWKVKFLTTGDLTFAANTKIDVFLVGGGGGGKVQSSNKGGSGGGGYTNSYSNYLAETGKTYHIVVGSGGACSSNGGSSTAFGYTAEGGKTTNSKSTEVYSGGDGGSGGAVFNSLIGAEDGNNAANSNPYYGGAGQGFTTREFGEELGTLYSTGGSSNNTLSVINNSGNGGNGGKTNSVCQASSGVVIIRNARIAKIYGEEYFSFSGSYEIFVENGVDWKVRFYTSGLLIPKVDMNIDAFLVGGGSGGNLNGASGGGGGGGGYTLTKKNINLYKDHEYNIIIGLGGKIGINGSNTSAFGYTAEGGKTSNSENATVYSGGDGGSGGAVFNSIIGAEDGNNAVNSNPYYGGTGQGFTTREFGEIGQTMYSGGGSSGSGECNTSGGGCHLHFDGYRNTGGGGCGGTNLSNTGLGGSGIVIIRNIRTVKVYDQDYFLYNGSYDVIEESNENWKVKFYSSGTLIPKKNMTIDVFLVGGGSGGKLNDASGGGGGGGGYTLTKKSINLYKDHEYNIIVGLGGKIGINGSNTSAFGYIAEGGKTSNSKNATVYSGGDGGSGGAVFNSIIGAEDGNDATNNSPYYGGFGQGYSTREFGEIGQTMYSGGGSSDSGSCNSSGGGCYLHYSGSRNTGGGGCGGKNISNTGVGGSGIVIIRNSRTTKLLNQDYFDYDGTYEVIEESNDNWKVKFYSSGTLIPKKNMNIDVFLVGGGSGGKIEVNNNGGGGGGGYTLTKTNVTLTTGISYNLIVGQGGYINTNGEATTCFGYTVEGGKTSNSENATVYSGGDGGSGGAVFNNMIGAEDGNDAQNYSVYFGGIGQGTTTREFGEIGQTLYSGGGSTGSGACNTSGGGCYLHYNGSRNTGGGGCGGKNISNTGRGGSGIIVIRNKRN